jgi:hypothetical protein
MAPALLVLSAIDPDTLRWSCRRFEIHRLFGRHADASQFRTYRPGLIIRVSVQAFSVANFDNLTFAFCEMREQTGSASKTKRLLP